MQDARSGRFGAVVATAVLTAGVVTGFLFGAGGPAVAIGGLCNGLPASHPWLDASGQLGPAVIEGTAGDDVIIGSDGDDRIDGNGGDDVVCGGPGADTLNVGPGGDSLVDGGPGDDSVTAVGVVHSVTFIGGPGDDELQVGDTLATSYLVGGPGNDLFVHDGAGHVKADGGDGFDVCLVRGGDEVVNCEY